MKIPSFMRRAKTDLEQTDLNKDLLNVTPIIEGFAHFVKSCDTPITISVQGDWGSGKTSMMGMLSNELKKNIPNGLPVKVHWINTWQYSVLDKKQDILTTLLIEIANALVENNEEENFLVKTINEFAKTYAKPLSLATALYGLTAPSIALDAVNYFFGGKENKKTNATIKNSVDNDNDTNNKNVSFIKALQQNFKDAVNSLVQNENDGNDSSKKYSKIVFIIDDLDRLQPRQAVEILEALKTLISCKGCVYVLAIDYNVVKEGVCAKYAIEDKYYIKKDEKFINDVEEKVNNFFDKIIQVRFTVPVKQYNIDKFVEDLLKNMRLDKELNKVYVSLINNYAGTNPRKIKRVFNSALLLYDINYCKWKDEEGSDKIPKNNAFIIALMIIISQIFFPNVYDWFVNIISCKQKNNLVITNEEIVNDETYKTFDKVEKAFIIDFCTVSACEKTEDLKKIEILSIELLKSGQKTGNDFKITNIEYLRRLMLYSSMV